MTERFEVQETRYFRLPFLPLVSMALPFLERAAWKADCWILQRWHGAAQYATGVAMRLVKRVSPAATVTE